MTSIISYLFRIPMNIEGYKNTWRRTKVYENTRESHKVPVCSIIVIRASQQFHLACFLLGVHRSVGSKRLDFVSMPLSDKLQFNFVFRLLSTIYHVELQAWG